MAASVRITILVDNQAGEGLAAEHGFALWIETGGKNILFDTGEGPALLHNAPQLGVDLATADCLVLSHGHHDHTGGVAALLEKTGPLDVYFHPGLTDERYAIRSGKAISIKMPPASAAALANLPEARKHPVPAPAEIFEGVGLTGPIPRRTAYEDTGGPFFLDPAAGRADPIEDELALWIRTSGGLVVCLGCGHAGVVNTLEHVRRLSGETKIRVVMGGFHLVEATPRRLELTAAALAGLDPELIIPCHCTGEPAVAALKSKLGSRVVAGRSGNSFEF